MQALQTYMDDLDCDPPFHSNRPFHLPLQVSIFDHEALEEIPFKQRCDFSDKIRRFWRANPNFLGCSFLQGPSRYAVCVN